MSKLAALDELLEQYYQLHYHQDSVLFQRLQDVQTWQRQRMQRTPQPKLSQKAEPLDGRVFYQPFIWWPRF